LTQTHADGGILGTFAGWAPFFGYFVNFDIALIGYSAAAVAFLMLNGLLLTVWRDRTRGSLLTLTSAICASWAAVLAYYSTQVGVPTSRILLVEMVHDSAWLIFLSSLLGGAVAAKSNWLVRRGGVVLALGLIAVALLLELPGLRRFFPFGMGKVLVMGSIGTALYALVGIEQLYRNARSTQQNGLNFLCLGLAGIFAFDLFLYTNAVIDGQISALFWRARGYVVVLCVPLLAVSVSRITSWKRGIFASRQIVFYTTTLLAAGIYLSLVGLAGYFIQTLGIEWSETLQLVFFSAAVLAFIALLLSEQLRARIRVFLTKHFFERKYDYRAEWLRLIHTLTNSDDHLPLKKRAIKSLAQIIGSRSGHIWLKNSEKEQYSVAAAWDTAQIDGAMSTGAALPTFLANKGRIIDVEEITRQSGKYDSLDPANLSEGFENTAFVIPLINESELIGFVCLSRPNTPVTLNFEDHDLLKTASQQIASYLVQAEATEQLAESRQFEAFNRFTAFVMHDLKNAIAQQSLVVENAERHKRNPEFIDDAMETIKGSVSRMQRVLQHLQQGIINPKTERVDVNKLLNQVTSLCSDRSPVPDAIIADDSALVRANPDRMLSGFTHAVRNAQDACETDGSVTVKSLIENGQYRIEITDTGCGMAQDFIRERLFRPFDSTKGAEGMGIGAYQFRETTRASGGDIEVQSEVGVGTTLILRLPLASGIQHDESD